MFFILSKTISYLAMPLSLVCYLLMGSVLVKKIRLKKILFWSGFGLLLFFSNDFIANTIMRAWEIDTISYAAVPRKKLGIVLTGATSWRPFPDDRIFFNKGADRVVHTVQLFKLGIIEKILISGGSGRLSGKEMPEANQFRKAMILMGVDSTHIIIENETRNTYESAVAVKPILDSLAYKDEDCLLITSAFHMRRSLAVYRKAGIQLKPFTTDFYTYPAEYTPDVFLVPKVEALAIWNKLFKEWMGFAAYKVAGYV